MSTPINVIIDNKTVLDDLVSVEMSQTEGTFCNSVTLSLKSKTFWGLCDPTTNFGQLRIKVVIGSDTYQFLIEERDTTSVGPGVDFTVWGRSKQALLAKPYSKTVNDTDDTSHPWQTGSTGASAIVAYVLSNYCDYSVTVDWNVNSFIVYEDSFSVSNQSPIEIISSLADVIGAVLIPNIDGSLSVETYSVAEGTSVETYNDLDDIVALDESVDYPSGYNAVTVYGYVTPAGGAGGGGAGGGGAGIASISATRTDSGDIYPGRDHTVRVYHYPNATVSYSFPEGSCQSAGSGTESITEDVTLIFGQGNTSKPNTSGVTEVTGPESVPITTESVTYSVYYRDYKVRADAVGDYEMLFYFADKSAYTTYSFTVVNEDGSDSDASCDDIVWEIVSPDNPGAGSTLTIRVYGETLPSTIYGGTGTADPVGEPDREQKSENVTFSNGVATLSYPISPYMGPPDVTFSSPIPYATSPIYAANSRTLTMNAFIGNNEYMSMAASVVYYTDYAEWKLKVPSSWPSTVFPVWFTAGGCEKSTEVTLSTTSSSSLRRDITINVKDYATEVIVEGASVYVDGAFKGLTDEDGSISIDNVKIGDHEIRITASGYIDSNLDDLANDTFTVSSPDAEETEE